MLIRGTIAVVKPFAQVHPTSWLLGEQQNSRTTIFKYAQEKIECFGAAQFGYKNPPKETREELAKFFEVDPNKKILLYAG